MRLSTRQLGAGTPTPALQLASGDWVPWPEPPLQSRQRVDVRVGDETTWVEAGLLQPSDWVAVPIARPRTRWRHRGSRRPSRSPRHPTSARLYVTALGVVDATVNGSPVSDDVLAPGWSAYQHRLAYDTYDVTALLREGDNELAGLLGDGWYRGNLLWGDRRHRCHYGDRLALLAQLEVHCADGTDVVVATGPDGWTSTDRRRPILRPVRRVRHRPDSG